MIINQGINLRSYPPAQIMTSFRYIKFEVACQRGRSNSFLLILYQSNMKSNMPQLGTDRQRATVWFFGEQETHHSHKS